MIDQIFINLHEIFKPIYKDYNFFSIFLNIGNFINYYITNSRLFNQYKHKKIKQNQTTITLFNSNIEVIDDDTNWLAEVAPKISSSEIFKLKKKLYNIRDKIQRLYRKTYNISPYRIPSHLAKTGWFSEALDKIRKKKYTDGLFGRDRQTLNLNNDILKLTYIEHTNQNNNFLHELHIKTIIVFNLSIILFFQEDLKTSIQEKDNKKWLKLIESEETIYNRIIQLNARNDIKDPLVSLIDGET